MKSTEKQVRYAMALLAKNGFSTKFMNASFKQFGATMKERSVKVEDWLYEGNASRVIDALK